MIRVTFDLLPGGNEGRARTIGVMEIANIRMHDDGTADYAVVMKKTPPFAGALRAAWKKGLVSASDRFVNDVLTSEDDDLIAGFASGHHRTKRGVYDLLWRAMRACGLDKRNPEINRGAAA